MIRVRRPRRAPVLQAFEAVADGGRQPAVDTALDNLRSDLQFAIEVEHATIPLYLTALYSLAEGKNTTIRGLIRSVVVEEMLHMALAANMLSAIGGKPLFTSPDFIPEYPGNLPFDIGDITVNLAPFSIGLVQTVFLKIEEPEHGALPFPPPPADLTATAADEHFETIGAFYASVRKQFEHISRNQNIFVPSSSQLLYPAGAFRVDSLADAIRAIDLIVQQGEGTTTLPLAGSGTELAHYYRFNQIVETKALVVDPLAPEGYSYTGWPISFDATAVYPILENAKVADYPADSLAARLARQFNGLYGNLLRTLEEAYAGKVVDDANIVGLMFDMKVVAQRLTSTPSGTPGKNAAPTFEYTLTHAAF